MTNGPQEPLRTRRRFLREVAVITGGLVAGGARTARAHGVEEERDDKLAIGVIGAGGRGFDNLVAVASEDIVALCDVDEERAAPAFAKFPRARRYRDFRRMLDAEEQNWLAAACAAL